MGWWCGWRRWGGSVDGMRRWDGGMDEMGQ